MKAKILLIAIFWIVAIGNIYAQSQDKRKVTVRYDPDEFGNTPIMQEYYVDADGTHNGPYTRYYRNGRILWVGNKKNGQPHGEFKIYRKDGSLNQIQPIENGEKHGEVKYYRKNGSLERTSIFENGKKHGIHKEYSNSSDAVAIGQYMNDQKHGKWTSYRCDKDECKVINGYYTIYENGEFVNCFNEKGQTLREEKQITTLNSITFQKNSHKMDEGGQATYRKFVELLKSTDINLIDNVLLVGHSEGSSELKKPYFDPKGQGHPFQNTENESSFTEAELENTRFILGYGRAKEVYNQLVLDFPDAIQLNQNNRLWIYSVGTHFWDKLENSQNCVQMIVYYKKPEMNYTTKEDSILNSEPLIDVGLNPAHSTMDPVLQERAKIFGRNRNYSFFNQTRFGGEGKNYFENFTNEILNEENYQKFMIKWSQ